MAKKDSYWFIKEKGIKFGYTYFIRFNKWLKIGSTTNLVQRFNSIRFSLPEECSLIGFFKTDKYIHLENSFLTDMASSINERGEWVIWSEGVFNELVDFWEKQYNIKLIRNDV